MMTASIRTASLALAATGLALSAPASALPAVQARAHVETAPAYGDLTASQYRDRWDRRDRRNYRNQSSARYRAPAYQQQRYYGERVYNNTRVWRGNDNRYYCRKSDGTTGLLIGGVAGALLGREIAGHGDRTLGAILGAAGGALLGKSIDSGTRCQ